MIDLLETFPELADKLHPGLIDIIQEKIMKLQKAP